MSAKEPGARRAVGSPVLTLWTLGYLVAGVALATAAAWPVYESPRAIVTGMIGGTAGVALGLLARARQWGAVLGGLGAVGAYLVLAVPLAVPAGLRSLPAFPGALRDAVLGVVTGWKQILTLAPPLGEYQAVLVPLLVVTLFGGFAASMLALHPGRRAVAAVLVVIAMSVFGIAFGVSGAGASARLGDVSIPAARELAVGVGVFAVSLTWLIGRSRLQRAAALRAVTVQSVARRGAPVWPAVRRRVLAGLLVVVALAAGVAVVPAASSWSARSVLRDDVEPMVVVRAQPSPLSAYRSWFSGERLGETVLRIDGDPGGIDRIRMVTLDSYDGQDFHISDSTRFTRLPRVAAPGDGRARLEITIGDAYAGIWLPAPGVLAAAPVFAGDRADALADGFHIDDDGATAITIAETADGTPGLVPGDRYTVVSQATATDETEFTGARSGEATLDPEAHPALAEWADLQEQPRTGAGFLELVDRLRSRGYLSHSLLDDDAASGWITALKAAGGYSFAPSYAGHSAARIEELFTSLREQQARVGADAPPEQLVAAVGDDEQFAAAAALLARHWGFESRVVIGFRLPEAQEVPGAVPCTDVCTGAGMGAWVEVRAAGGDWVAVDVTPQFALLPSTITEGEQLPEHPTVPEQPRSDALDPPPAQNDSQSDAAPLQQQDSALLDALLPVLRVAGISLLALVLLVLPLVVVLVAKQLRRRGRLTADDAEARLVGAWEELADIYVDSGIPLGQTGTRVQSARVADRPAAVELAGIVDQAVFSPHPPTDADADTAWDIVDRERAELASGAPRRQRLRARLSLRSSLLRIRAHRGRALSLRRRALDTLAVAGTNRQENA
ncbi:transglutaminase domain-containing protein [Microbacterium sp. NPDC058342]|uniref:transglutaminase domain-containing protein n=1 Tax=Microbacterium sp. NPDC058342 TaxID=3346454 RepID=UPI0036519D71